MASPILLTSGKALLYGARKTSFSFSGAVGVMTYYIPKMHSTLAVMFSIPYVYNSHSNLWNVALKRGDLKADNDMYDGMYHGTFELGYKKPMKGNNRWESRYLGHNLKARGAMSNSGTATLEIHVEISKKNRTQRRYPPFSRSFSKESNGSLPLTKLKSNI